MLRINDMFALGHSRRVEFVRDWETSSIATRSTPSIYTRKFMLADDLDFYNAKDFTSKLICDQITKTNTARIIARVRSILKKK